MRRFLRFRLSTFLMFIGMFAMALGWWRDHENLQRQLDDVDLDVFTDALETAGYWKQHLWHASSHLRCGTDTVEGELGEHIDSLEGDFTTAGGWGDSVRLRKPTKESALKVVALLNHDNSSIRSRVARLVALYGEAFHWTQRRQPLLSTNPESQALDALSTEATPKLLLLLNDPNAEVRGAAALALGYLAPRFEGLKEIVRAYRREEDQTARLHLAWAVQRKFVY